MTVENKSASTRRKVGAKLGILSAAVLSAGTLFGMAYTNPDKAANLSRTIIGDENTAQLEQWYFSLQDVIDGVRFRLIGGPTNPFLQQTTEEIPIVTTISEESTFFETSTILTPPKKPTPLVLPETVLIQPNPAEGEGMWTSEGLPYSTTEDILMARTFIRPDITRPNASTGILLVDKRRIRLNLVGGTTQPGGDRGVYGPGVIPEEDKSDLLVAWNGGFQGPHGGYGMYTDGKTYRPLRDGLASVVVTSDGKISMGEWGRTILWDDSMIAVRQNGPLLVEDCEVTPLALARGQNNDIWGYVDVNSAEFSTWRSGIALSANGDLMIAAGNNLSAKTLALAFKAAGACSAMQLDINSPHAQITLFQPLPDGSIKGTNFMDSMTGRNPRRFLTKQERDFMYLTYNESRYLP